MTEFLVLKLAQPANNKVMSLALKKYSRCFEFGIDEEESNLPPSFLLIRFRWSNAQVKYS